MLHAAVAIFSLEFGAKGGSAFRAAQANGGINVIEQAHDICQLSYVIPNPDPRLRNR